MKTHAEVQEYLEELIRAIELERKEEIRQFEAVLKDTALDSELCGIVMNGLFVRSTGYTVEGDFRITLSYSDGREMPLFGFEPGDGISLSAVFSGEKFQAAGTIYDKSENWIDVTLNKKRGLRISKSGDITAEPSVNPVTFERMSAAVRLLKDSEDDLVMKMKWSAYGVEDAFKKDEIGMDFIHQQLNEGQKEAVVRLNNAAPLATLHGPPGTGKTTVICELAAQAVKRKESVYMTAPSNNACDHLVRSAVKLGMNVIRIGNPARVGELERSASVKRKCLDHPHAEQLRDAEDELNLIRKKIKNKGYDEGLTEQKNRLKAEVRRIQKGIVQSVMSDADVFVGTPSGLYDPILRGRHFDLILFDEATQATEPIGWMAALNSKRCIFGGDPMQLPAMVICEEARRMGLEKSLFERICGSENHVVRAGLKEQYRMAPIIMNFISESFYGGTLIAAGERENKNVSQPGVFEFIDTAGAGYAEELDPAMNSFFNTGEAKAVGHVIEELISSGADKNKIIVITPYRAQVRKIKDQQIPETVQIGTVDSFQGRESNVVIFSCVRSNPHTRTGFLKDVRRLNVALSRASEKIIIIGDSATLVSLPVIRDAVEYAEQKGVYRSIWETGWVEM